MNRCELFEDASSAVHRVLGEATHSRVHVHSASGRTADMSAAAGVPRSTEQQLLGLHLLGRSLLAAQPLLQQVPHQTSASGAFVMATATCLVQTQYKKVAATLRLLIVNVMRMHKILQQDGAAAAAVAAGAAGAAATPADLARLLQQAEELEVQLHSMYAAFCPADYDAQGYWAGRSPQQARDSMPASSAQAHQVESSMCQLRAACQ